VKGISVYSYEGRLICSPKVAGLRPEQLKPGNISLSPDTVAIIDRAKPNCTWRSLVIPQMIA
jgi:hypothetical protein